MALTQTGEILPGQLDRPLTMVDVAVFTVHENRLEVLLVRRPNQAGEPFPNCWAFPGSFLDPRRDGNLEACARRTLLENAGVADLYLEQLGSWGSRDRDPRGWSSTHVYLALTSDLGEAQGSSGSELARWFPLRGGAVKAPLAFDHKELLAAAVGRLRSKAEYTSLPVYLLPQEFTLTELQRAFELVLGRTVEKSAFRSRIKAAQFIVEVPKLRLGQQRPAQLYRVRKPAELVWFPRTFSPRTRD